MDNDDTLASAGQEGIASGSKTGGATPGMTAPQSNTAGAAPDSDPSLTGEEGPQGSEGQHSNLGDNMANHLEGDTGGH